MSLDLRILAGTLAISVLAGVLVGLAPAIATVRRDLGRSVHEGGRSIAGGVSARRIRRALVVLEFALAIVLLAGAGLLVRSWWYLNQVDPGFKPEQVLVMELSAPTSVSRLPQRFDLYQRTLEEIQAVPGVEDAGAIGDLFIANSRDQVVTVDRGEGIVSQPVRLRRDEVSADFFKAIGAPLLRGRFFSNEDGPDASRVAIVNDAMARHAWPGHEAVGKRFKLGPADSDRPWYTVVGVVGNMRRQGLEREAVPQMFEPLAQSAPGSVDLVVRTSSRTPLAMAAALRAAVRRVDRNAPIYGVAPLEQQLGTYLTQRRFETLLLAGFSIVALLMAAVGINGLIQFSIATRTNEIGLRMAIGAQARDIFRMVIGEGLALGLTGLAFGLGGAWWLGRVESSLVFGVRASDPVTFIGVSLLLIAVATAACFWPARRATRIDPIETLRVT
jgi:putative ABC transport system permease protein